MLCVWSVSPLIFGLKYELPIKPLWLLLGVSQEKEELWVVEPHLPHNCNHIWVHWCCRSNILLLCIPSVLSPGVQHWAEAFASSLIMNTRSAFRLFFPSLCVCSDSKLWLQISVEESFEPWQLFLEANYCVLVNEPGRKNVKYIRLAATCLLSKGKTLTDEIAAVAATSW